MRNNAFNDGYLSDGNVAIDAGHFEARDQAPSKKKELEPKTTPKKLGRKPKTDREQWLEEKEALKASLPIYEEKIEDQLPVSYDEIHDQMSLDPKWGVKKNSEGKHAYWFGFKGHFDLVTMVYNGMKLGKYASRI